jgi:type II secretory ATPase GspE/PulE/Tfp pilus assembly ATPase PilB-like protein
MNDHIGLSFSRILKSVLRQDPDIIMIGEIRDQETAALAAHASNTGHLILATLHANYAYEAFSRLQSLDLSLERILYSTTLIVAQRLMRKLCHYCKYATPLSAHHPLKSFLQPSQILYEAKGCDRCHHGYHRLTAIYELLSITEELAQLILNQSSQHAISSYLDKQQWISLHHACLAKLISGETSYSEYLRILGETDAKNH